MSFFVKNLTVFILFYSLSNSSFSVSNQDLKNRIDDLEMEMMIQQDINRQIQQPKTNQIINVDTSSISIGKDVNGGIYSLYKPSLKRNTLNNIVFDIFIIHDVPISYRSKVYETSTVSYELDCNKNQIRQTHRQYMGGISPNVYFDEDKTLYGYSLIGDDKSSFFNIYKKLFCR